MTVEPRTSTATRTLAEYVAATTFDDIPTQILETAKLYILDSIGCILGGATLPHGKVAIDLYAEMGGRPEATILPTGQKVPCLNAAYVNGALANVLDFDDCYRDIAHPAATIVPPALAVGEKLGASGKDLLTAVVLGYEVSLRVCDAIRPTPARWRQVRGMATWQIFGAATVASKLMRLDADLVAQTFGHAAANAPAPFKAKTGLYPDSRPYSQIKNNFGWAAMGGVLAAELAARGLSGNRNVFEGRDGFWAIAGSDRCDFDRYTTGLGTEYLMPVTALKPYACCRQTHSTLDALHALIAEHRIDPRQVDHVLVESVTSIHDGFDVRKPAHIVDVQFSVPPLVALTLAGYSPSRGIAADHLDDPLVQDLIGKVDLRIDPEADRIFQAERHMPSTVTVRLKDGTELRRAQHGPRGEPEEPLDPTEVKTKFLTLAAPVVGEERAARLLGQAERLETVEQVAEMC